MLSALTLQRHLIYSLAHSVLGGVVTSPCWLALMLSNRPWPSSLASSGGGLPHPGQRVRDRLLAARVMTHLRVKLMPSNLFYTTKIISIVESISPQRLIRPPVAALDALDTPGDCAAAPTRPTPGRLQSYTSAGVRRPPRSSATATR
jgi:hypothetical protein